MCLKHVVLNSFMVWHGHKMITFLQYTGVNVRLFSGLNTLSPEGLGAKADKDLRISVTYLLHTSGKLY